MLNIAIADDHLLFAQSLKHFLEAEKNMNVIGIARNGLELLEIVAQHQIGLAIIDIRMPVMDGVATCKALRSLHAEIKIVMISMFEEAGLANELKSLGANGFISKTCSGADLINAINAAYSGEALFSRFGSGEEIEMPRPAIARPNIGELTNREKEIVSLIGKGFTSPAIAAKLFISINTIKEHRKNILKKLNLKNVQELVAWAITNRFC